MCFIKNGGAEIEAAFFSFSNWNADIVLSACTGNPREPSAESTNVSDETNSAGASEAANHMDHTKLTQWSSNTAISPLKKSEKSRQNFL